jgi:hypothetical protein
MRAWPIVVLIFLTHASDCFAYGSIATGYAGSSIRFTKARNWTTPKDAQSYALNECRRLGLMNCQSVIAFQNTCVSVAISSATGHYYYTGGKDPDHTRQIAVATCVEHSRTAWTQPAVDGRAASPNVRNCKFAMPAPKLDGSA